MLPFDATFYSPFRSNVSLYTVPEKKTNYTGRKSQIFPILRVFGGPVGVAALEFH